jgi:phosphorylase/glycogen(starch) synthase
MAEKLLRPDYLFEVSWEVCNKVGGIHTVISTKVLTTINEYGDQNYILIGPDVWKETRVNPEFIEDKYLYRAWKEKAESDKLPFRIGRWNVPGKPIVILINFTALFSNKDKIFKEYWEKYQLDSLSGQWDYVEPALFGYAAGKIIESFYEFNLSAQDKIVAHFHEWMTGLGILYLRDRVPQVGLVFTTHATVLGRSVAGIDMSLYDKINAYNSAETAKQLKVVSKNSLETISAKNCDIFTTVSEVTANECKHFLDRYPDVITPNGFENSFVPEERSFLTKRNKTRNKLLEVTEALLGYKVSKDSIFIISSGRYEFRNKGLDLFIDALVKINSKNIRLKKQIIAFIAVPANNKGVNTQLQEKLKKKDTSILVKEKYLTHLLREPDNDPVLKKIKDEGLNNSAADKVKVIFMPVYLDGDDGIFNLRYYDFLIGFDYSVFPSYYEPWGYTPLESLGFNIPTITTSISGFGRWLLSINADINHTVRIIERTDANDSDVVEKIAGSIIEFSGLTGAETDKIRKNAGLISKSVSWKNLFAYYKQSYSLALNKVNERFQLFKSKTVSESLPVYSTEEKTQPEWRKILVQPSVPENLEKLQKLVNNLWWTWNYEAAELFELIDKDLWKRVKGNPKLLLESLSYQQLTRLAKSKPFKDKLNIVYKKYNDYITKPLADPPNPIAYFSMEYGLHHTLTTYSGGLGVLAGDYLKQASDSGVNMIGIGVLYRYGYFVQNISILGEQISEYKRQRFSKMPVIPVMDNDGNLLKISIALPGRIVNAKVWLVNVGRIPLYLMDTDIEDNSEADRFITHQLYGGDNENRLKQEMLLGIGGIRLLKALDITPSIYHCNEGHAAFITLERLRKFIQEENIAHNQAIELVRASTLFTTHTPVPAGHDSFSEDLLRTYLSHYTEHINISWENFINLGRFRKNNTNEKFSMSILAARLSQEMNGVSKLHGKVTREMFSDLYDGFFPGELHIGHVTNGVHYQTWTAKQWQLLYLKEFGKDFLSDQSNPLFWKKIKNVPDKIIWNIRKELKKELIAYLKERLNDDLTDRQENPNLIFETIESINEDSLIIGFARRFATYKRAYILFDDLERLSRMVNNENRPVLFIFAGKAHPQDKAGQDLIKKIVEISKKQQFLGKIIFIKNYNLEVAKKLVRGADLWLNTPTRLMEASGTSGQKAAINGVLNFSVLDGWWHEGYRSGAGWAIRDFQTYDNQDIQNRLDAEIIYNMLEDEIIPLYFKINDEGINSEWIACIKNDIAEIAPQFTTKRMLDDYRDIFYKKLLNRTKAITRNNYKLAKQIASWKRKVMKSWKSIEVIFLNLPDTDKLPLKLGDKFKAEITLNLHELSENDIGVELIFRQNIEGEEKREVVKVAEMELAENLGDNITYSSDILIDKPGVYDYAIRILPKNKLLPHRQDFNLVKWI